MATYKFQDRFWHRDALFVLSEGIFEIGTIFLEQLFCMHSANDIWLRIINIQRNRLLIDVDHVKIRSNSTVKSPNLPSSQSASNLKMMLTSWSSRKYLSRFGKYCANSHRLEKVLAAINLFFQKYTSKYSW